MNAYQKKMLKEIGGITPGDEFDFERDFLEKIDRARLGEVVRRLGPVESGWQRVAARRLMASGPSPEDWLVLAGCWDPSVKNAAREHLLANDPSDDALWFIVLAGSSTRTQKRKAVELILKQSPPRKKSLKATIRNFKKGPLARKAWNILKNLDVTDDELASYVLQYAEDKAILKQAWEMLAARNPSEDDISSAVVYCTYQPVTNAAGAVLLATGTKNPDYLMYIVFHCDEAATREAAAERLLRMNPKWDHLATIAASVENPALAEEAWKRFRKNKLSARNGNRMADFRTILCFSKQASIRAEAFDIAKTAPLDATDREFIATHATDAEVRDYFAAPAGG